MKDKRKGASDDDEAEAAKPAKRIKVATESTNSGMDARASSGGRILCEDGVGCGDSREIGASQLAVGALQAKLQNPPKHFRRIAKFLEHQQPASYLGSSPPVKPAKSNAAIESHRMK